MTPPSNFIGMNRARQQGVIVLAIMLILLAGSTYMLVKKYNANAIKARAETRALEALDAAKQALLSYAVSYPDNVNPDEGPGYLLCPDVTNDGFAGGSCSDSGNTTIGRFPYRTLEMPELRDGSGTRLWYVVSENFRNNPKIPVLNSDTPGQLQVDGTSDIVAIIFAPGEPMNGQDNRGSVTENIDDYLEGENADLDQIFTRSGSGGTNDRLALITRDELMSAVERRVINEVGRVLTDYRTDTGWNVDAYPWLSPYTNPESSAFKGIAGTYLGHLPFHWSGDTPGSNNRNPFVSDLTLAWNTISNADIQFILDSTYDASNPHYFELPTPTAGCVENSECNTSADSFNGDVPEENDIAGGECIWSSREIFECEGQFDIPEKIGTLIFSSQRDIYGYKNGLNSTAPGLDYLYTNTSGSWAWEIAYINDTGSGYDYWPVIPLLIGDISRTYKFEIKYEDPAFDDTSIVPPDSTSARTRAPRIDSGPLLQDDVEITVTDNMVDIIYYPRSAVSPSEQTSQTRLSSLSGTTGTISASGIKYDLDVDDSELPAWFVQNEWHEHIYIAYADSENYPGDEGSSCTPGSDCLIVHWVDNTGPGANPVQARENVRALVLIAGKQLSGQDRSGAVSPPELSDYLEDDGISSNCQNDPLTPGSSICNYDEDAEFLYGSISDDFNDRIRVVLPN